MAGAIAASADRQSSHKVNDLDVHDVAFVPVQAPGAAIARGRAIVGEPDILRQLRDIPRPWLRGPARASVLQSSANVLLPDVPRARSLPLAA